MSDITTLDERFAELERRLDNEPAWISTGPEPHHVLRLDTAERLLHVLRTKHAAAFASALSEVMTGQAITVGRPRARRD